MEALLSGKRVGVVGVSTGLGYALGFFLLKDGASILINARNKEKLGQIKENLSKYGKVEIFPGSMDLNENVEAFFNTANKNMGGIDHLVITIGGYVEDSIMDPKGLDSMLNSQVKIPLNIVSKAIPHLHSGSCIVMVSAMRGITKSLPNQLSYGIAKAAVAKAVETIALSLLDTGIRVVGIAPSVIDGDFEPERDWRKLRKLGDWKAPPEDFASVISLLLTERMEWVNGVVIPVDGGAFLR